MTKLLRSVVALSILVAVPGLAPYQAAAQVAAGRVAPVSGIALPAVGVSPLGSTTLPESTLSVTLTPSLSGSALVAPDLGVMAAPSVSAAQTTLSATAVQTSLPKAVIPSALKPVAIAAVKPVQPGAKIAPAALALQNGVAAVSAAAKADDVSASKEALDKTFDASETSVPTALDVVGLRSASKAELTPNDGKHDGDKPAAPAAPKSSLKRTFSVGFVAAAAPLVFMTIVQVVAAMLGYHAHPGYVPPSAGADPTVFSALALMIGAAVLAPISEEAIFRGGLQGTLSKITKKLRLGDFAVPAAIVATLFVAVHEMSDPLLFGIRFVHAMVLAYVYKKEGILASMAAHGFFNGLLSLGLLFSVLGVAPLGILIFPAAAWLGWRLAKNLKAQQGDVASGAVAPVRLSARAALLMAVALILGFLFIMPNVVWPVGAIALLIKAFTQWRADKKAKNG